MSYKMLLERAGKTLLYVNRIKIIANEIYQIVNKKGPPLVHGLVTTKECNLRDDIRAIQPKVRTIRYGLQSLHYEGAKIWNNMPIDIKRSTSYAHFKHLIKLWSGPSCKCGACILCF